MQLATVLGQVVSTAKDPGLGRYTLLLLRDMAGSSAAELNQQADQGAAAVSYVAVDLIGAGTGEVVLVVSGSSARVATGADAPTDRAVVAIVDSVIEEGTVTYSKA